MFVVRRVTAKLSLFAGGGGLIMVGRGGCGQSWMVATKICPVVSTGCEFMSGLGWSHDLVILQAFLFFL